MHEKKTESGESRASRLISGLALLFFSFGVQANTTVIEVFVDTPTVIPHIPHAEVVVYDLSLSDRIKKRVPKLPADEEQAKAIMQGFINSSEGKAWKARLVESAQPTIKLLQYQLEKVPAIVFDHGRAVVYGSTDIREAILLYDHYLEKEGK